MAVGVRWLEDDGLANESNAHIGAAGLKRQNAQHMMGGGVPGVNLQNLGIGCFRLRKIAALMIAHSQIKQLGRRHFAISPTAFSEQASPAPPSLPRFRAPLARSGPRHSALAVRGLSRSSPAP